MAGLWRPRGRWLWAGALFGLAGLAEASGILLAIAAAVAAGCAVLKVGRRPSPRRGFSWQAVGLFTAGWLIAASPVLVQRARESSDPLSLIGDVSPASVAQPGPSRSWTRSLSDSATQFAETLSRQPWRFAGVFARSAQDPRAVFLFSALVSVLLFGLACLGLLREQDSRTQTFTAVFLASVFLLMTVTRRDMAAPLSAVLAWFAAGQIVKLRSRWAVGTAWLPSGVIVLLMGALVVSDRGRLPANPGRALEPPADYVQLMTWYGAHVVQPGNGCLHTLNCGTRFRFFWLLGGNTGLEVPSLANDEELALHAARTGARYLIVEEHAPATLPALFGKFLANDPVRGLVEIRALPGWRHVAADNGAPRTYIIYERFRLTPQPPAPVRLRKGASNALSFRWDPGSTLPYRPRCGQAGIFG